MRTFLTTFAVLIAVVALCGSAVPQEPERTPEPGTVAGVLGIVGGGPMMGGTIFFVDEASGPPPSATKYWRVPTHAFPIDQQARFSATLPAGNYFLGAIERKSGDELGPPQEGDFFFIAQDENGSPKRLTVWKGSAIDLGMVVEARPFQRSSLAKKGITSMQGTIRDEAGRPVPGMVVFAFTSQSMFGRPLFVSERSGKDGKYLLRVAGAGKYYLRARTNYGGGPPAIGELMGFYLNGKPVVLKKNERRSGVNITVAPVGM